MNIPLDLLKKLIRCKPVSDRIDQVNAAESVMRNYLESKGLYCVTEQIDGRSVLYASTLPGKVQDFLLNAHLDVVPAPEEMFEPVEKDGRLHAGGSSDCLGNAVCIAEVLCRCAGKASVSAFFTADEEIGGSTTAAMVEKGYGARKMAIILDAAPYAIAHAQKGMEKGGTLRNRGSSTIRSTVLSMAMSNFGTRGPRFRRTVTGEIPWLRVFSGREASRIRCRIRRK